MVKPTARPKVVAKRPAAASASSAKPAGTSSKASTTAKASVLRRPAAAASTAARKTERGEAVRRRPASAESVEVLGSDDEDAEHMAKIAEAERVASSPRRPPYSDPATAEMQTKGKARAKQSSMPPPRNFGGKIPLGMQHAGQHEKSGGNGTPKGILRKRKRSGDQLSGRVSLQTDADAAKHTDKKRKVPASQKATAKGRTSDADAEASRDAADKEKDWRCERRSKYTPDEDDDMIQWVRDHPEVKGDRLWQMAAEQDITHHSWQSMRNRWRRHLVNRADDDDAADDASPERQPIRSLGEPSSPARTRSSPEKAASPAHASSPRRQSPPRSVRRPVNVRPMEPTPSAASSSREPHGRAEMMAEVMVRLLKRQAALGREMSPETDFDGRWLGPSGDVYIVHGRGTDLRVGETNCHFKPLSQRTCELMIFDKDSTDLLHVVSGRLSSDLQRLEWSNGKVWKRSSARAADTSSDSANITAALTEEVHKFFEEHNKLKEENRRLRGAASGNSTA